MSVVIMVMVVVAFILVQRFPSHSMSCGQIILYYTASYLMSIVMLFIGIAAVGYAFIVVTRKRVVAMF